MPGELCAGQSSNCPALAAFTGPQPRNTQPNRRWPTIVEELCLRVAELLGLVGAAIRLLPDKIVGNDPYESCMEG